MSQTVVTGIQAAGEVAFLHVMEGNDRAIALYERLGFERRALRTVTPLVRL